MTESSIPTNVPDLRVVQANERTLLAWVRTALGIMAFGFVVARLGLWLREIQPASSTSGGSLWVGVALVVFGSLVLVSSAFRFARTHRSIVAGEPHVPGTLAGVVIASFLAVAGLALAVYLASRQ
jgi:putative membrane protein